MPIQVPFILISSKLSAYYSRTILYAFRCLLFSKLCWHNLSKPTGESSLFAVEVAIEASTIATCKGDLTACTSPGGFARSSVVAKDC